MDYTIYSKLPSTCDTILKIASAKYRVSLYWSIKGLDSINTTHSGQHLDGTDT